MNSNRLHSVSSAPRGALLRVALLAAVMVALPGCKTMKGWFETGKSAEAKAAAKPADLTDFVPSATVARMWSADAGSGEPKLGVVQGPAIADGHIYLRVGDLLYAFAADAPTAGAGVPTVR